MDTHVALRTRRSHKLFTGLSASDDQLARWVELATWAPNHKFTEPWRFTVVRQASLPAVSAAIRDRLVATAGADADALEAAHKQAGKIAGILQGAGGAIAVRQRRTPDNPERDKEDFAACACAIQNIQLAAWADGFGSYWTTSPHILGVPHAFAVQDGELLVGVVVLGQPAAEMKAFRPSAPEALTTWK